MSGFIIGEKSEQKQLFDEQGNRIPVTMVRTAPCHLVGVRWPEKDGYFAVQLGYGTVKNIAKPQKGHLTKAGIKTPLRFLSEFRLGKDIKKIEENGKLGVQIGDVKIFIGDEVKSPMVFKVGDLICASGTSKGKGFQGVVKRHKFAGGPRTHGQSDRERAPGSVGPATTPGRVYRGTRMAGHMGAIGATVQNLKVVAVDEQSITIKGVIPGPTHGLVKIYS